MRGNSDKRAFRLRYVHKIERYEPFAFVAAWPILFLTPYGGYWRWLVAFAPELLLRVVRAFRRRSGVLVTTRRVGNGVELVGESGEIVDRLEDGAVDHVSRLVDSAARPESVTVSRTDGKAMSFTTGSTDEVGQLLEELKIDLDRVRSRYRGASRATRLSFALLVGFGIVAWTMVAPPSAPQLRYWLAMYTNWVTLPLCVLFAIETPIEIGVDGVAWRWLFLRGYLPFATMTAVEAAPGGFRITTNTGRGPVFALPSGTRALFGQHLHDAWGQARERRERQLDTPDTVLERSPDEGIAVWIERLGASRATPGAYRSRSTTHLWEVAEDVAASLEARFGALIVLCTTPAARERARAIATRIVAPHHRAAVEAIAEDKPAEELVKCLSLALLDEPRR